MNIVIVDDDPLVAASLKIILEKNGEGEDPLMVQETFGSGREIIEYCEKNLANNMADSSNRVDVILMDIRMDDINGIEAAEKLLGLVPDTKIIFLTTFLDDEYISKALTIGVSGYILKQECASLPEAVRAAFKGQKVYGSKIVEKLPDMLNRTEKFDYSKYDISDKELEVIKYVAEGLSNKEIAEKLFFSEGTVRNIVSTVLSKLELRDRTQLAIFYLTH